MPKRRPWPHLATLQHGEAAARQTLTKAIGSCPSPCRVARGNTGSSVLLVPGSMSSKLERASGWRSSDFGVKIIS